MRGGGNPTPRRFAALAALVGTVILVAAPEIGFAAPAPAGKVSAAAALLAAVRSGQTAVIDADYGPHIAAARSALATSDGLAATDRFNLSSDGYALAAADRAVSGDEARLRAADDALEAATAADEVAQANLATDRDHIRALAIEMYTGGDNGALLSNNMTFSGSQQSVFGQTEVAEVVGLVVRDLHADVTTARRDAVVLARSRRRAASDQAQLGTDELTVVQETSRVATDRTQLAAADQMVSSRGRSLAAVLAAEARSVKALSGPSTARGLSVLGPPALNAAQLVAWYSWAGYADLTSAPISQLAGWYIQAGHQLGVRGDVAFAQATLETGGFSSSDAVTLNNYAGIGHCDTCAAGWGFPSPKGGVVGQLQLLRIFADPGPATSGSPSPVLPALTADHEPDRGCCSSWEALTGVWATDPTYGTKILSIYEQMLQFTVQGAPAAPAVPALSTGS